MIRLLAITEASVADVPTTLRRAEALLHLVDPRSVAFGVRDHALPARQRVSLTRALVALARPLGAKVVVHDRVDVALAAQADGVQLGERSVSVREARSLLGATGWIGRSCHDAEGMRAAASEGVDAVTLSPVFASPGKGEPLGLARFAALRATVPSLPVLALGGIDAARAAEVLDAGASGVAMIRAWLEGEPSGWAPVLARL